MTSSDKVNAANAEWAMYIISSCSVGRKGMYNPATRQTVKWTDMATVVDKDEDSEKLCMYWESTRTKKESTRIIKTGSLKLLMLELVLKDDSLTLKNCKS